MSARGRRSLQLPLVLGWVLLAGVTVGCSTSDPAKAIATARRHVAEGDRRQAIFELREFVRRHPQHGDVRLVLAGLQIEQGDPAGAKLTLQGLDPAAAATTDALLDRLRIASAEGRFQDALDDLQAHGGALAPAVHALEEARLLRALGRRDDALALVRRAQAANPDSVPLSIELASELAGQGDLAGARSLLERAAGRGSDPEALAALGSLDLRLERPVLAARELGDALRAATPQWPSTRRWAVELELADADLAQRRVKDARELLTALRKDIPGALGVRLLDARLALLDGRPRDVVRLLAPLADEPSVDPRVVLLYTTALVQTGETEQARLAVGALQNRIAANPSAEGWRILGSAQAAVHDLPAASRSMDEAYRLAPSARTATEAFRVRAEAGGPDPERSLRDWLERAPHDAGVRFLLGQYDQARGLTADAQREYEAAVNDDPRNFAARNNLAAMLTATDPARAETLAREANRLAPGTPAIEDTLGWILLRREDLRDGLALLASAARRLPRNDAVQYHYAVALARSGRPQEARLILETLLLSRREFGDRAEATRLLDSLSTTTNARTRQDG